MKEYLLIGTYTDDSEQGTEQPFGGGVCQFEFDENKGTIKFVEVYREYDNPSYLEADGELLYIVQELQDNARISIMRYDRERGKYSHQMTKSFRGSGSCHVTVWPGRDYLSVANYGSGSLLVLRLDENGLPDGTVYDFQDHGKGTDPVRQEGPHMHSTVVSPDGSIMLAADLGIDTVKWYQNSEEAVLPLQHKDIFTGEGEGPRHMCFRPDGRVLYLATELGCHVLRYEYDSGSGIMLLRQRISTRREGAVSGNTAADIHLSSDSRFLYVSNRGDDSIAVYSVSEADGALKLRGIQSCGGRTPRSFTISQSGKYLIAANQDSDSIVVFKRNTESGMLEEKVGELAVRKPVCVKLAVI